MKFEAGQKKMKIQQIFCSFPRPRYFPPKKKAPDETTILVIGIRRNLRILPNSIMGNRISEMEFWGGFCARDKKAKKKGKKEKTLIFFPRSHPTSSPPSPSKFLPLPLPLLPPIQNPLRAAPPFIKTSILGH